MFPIKLYYILKLSVCLLCLIQILPYQITDLFEFQISGHTKASFSAGRLEDENILCISINVITNFHPNLNLLSKF